MKNQFYCIICALFLINPARSQSPSFVFAYGFGNNYQDQGTSVARDVSGNVYMTGNFSGIVDFDPSPSSATLASNGFSDIFIAKYNAAGQYQWAISMGGALTYDSGNSIITDGSGNVYVTGVFGDVTDFDPSPSTSTIATASGDKDIFLAKYNSSGQYQWAVAFQGPGNASGNSLALSPSGEIIVAGEFMSYSDFDGSSSTYTLSAVGVDDFFITKYTSGGAFISAFSVGGPGHDHGTSIACDALGNMIITGAFDQPTDFDPGSGTTLLLPAPGFNGEDIYVAKYNSSGNFQWAMNMGSNSNDEGFAVAVDQTGNSYVSGYFTGTASFDPANSSNTLVAAGANDIYLAKYDPAGNFIWAQALGGAGYDNGRSLVIDNAGFVYLTGNFEMVADFDAGPSTYSLSSAGMSDIFTAKFNSSGALVWAFAAGGSGADIALDLDINNNGTDIFCVGNYQTVADFDPSPSTASLSSNGVDDAFLARYNDLTVGLSERKSSPGANVYPSPFSETLTIQSPESATAILYNTLGEVIDEKIISAGENKFIIAQLQNGIYYMHITSGRETTVHKLVKTD